MIETVIGEEVTIEAQSGWGSAIMGTIMVGLFSIGLYYIYKTYFPLKPKKR